MTSGTQRRAGRVSLHSDRQIRESVTNRDCDGLGDTEHDRMKLGAPAVAGGAFPYWSWGVAPAVPPRGTRVSWEGHQPRYGSYVVFPVPELRLGRAVTLAGWSPGPVLASVPWFSPSSEVLSVTEEYLTAPTPCPMSREDLCL